MCDLSGCAFQRKLLEVSDSMQIGQAGKGVENIFSWDVNWCLRAILKSVVVLSVGIPSVACTPAIWRGSDGVEDRFGCCLTFSFSSPLSPICLGNHTPRCREKGRVGARRKIQLTERQKWGENREPENGQNTGKVTDFSWGNVNSLLLINVCVENSEILR